MAAAVAAMEAAEAAEAREAEARSLALALQLQREDVEVARKSESSHDGGDPMRGFSKDSAKQAGADGLPWTDPEQMIMQRCGPPIKLVPANSSES